MFRTRNVMFPAEVMCASRVRCVFGTRKGTHHITASKVSNITMQSITSLGRRQNFTKISKSLISGGFSCF